MSGLPDEKQRRAWLNLTTLRDGLTRLALARRDAGDLEIVLIFVETVPDFFSAPWRGSAR